VNDSWFVNLSKTDIPQDVRSSLLQLGDKFCLRSHHNSQRFIFDFIKCVESNIFRTDPDTANNIRCLAIQTLNKCLSPPPPLSDIDSRFSTLTRITKKFLLDHPDIIITKADKGNVTVSLDRTDYLNKMHGLLSDRDTYITVNCDPTRKITTQLKDLLQRWRRNNYIPIGTYRSLLNTDGILPRAYGLPKIHKKDCPLRIIISSINSPLYSLAAFLHDILYKNLPFPI